MTVAAVTTAMGKRPATTAFHRFVTYTVQRDDLPMYWGNDGDVDVRFDSTRDCLDIDPAGKFVDCQSFNLGDRLHLVERFHKAPKANADILNATESTRMVANGNFEILGTNATSDDSTLYAEGGVTIETDGASTDSVIILPHLDSGQSAWTTVTWGSDQETHWECSIKTGTTAQSLTGTVIWAGLKLTNTDVIATDADSAYFRYEAGVASGVWQTNYSIGGTDTTASSTVTVAQNTAYRLKITIDSSRIARFYINGVLITTSTALTDAKDFIPYVGVMCKSGTAAARRLYVRHIAMSRKYA